ncbi:MAG: hypothetical protein KKD56_06160, partial [Acidobacteria bacterium]|nr:hypothetical protein [Acidobacteriota bacterium]
MKNIQPVCRRIPGTGLRDKKPIFYSTLRVFGVEFKFSLDRLIQGDGHSVTGISLEFPFFNQDLEIDHIPSHLAQ